MIIVSILAIVDRLIDLLKERREVDRNTFAQLIEPLFERFEPAAENYILLFERLGQDAADSKSEEGLVNAFERFRHDRLDFGPTRRAVTTLAHEYSEAKVDEELVSFFGNLEGFFYTSGEEESMSRQLEDKLRGMLRGIAFEQVQVEEAMGKIDRYQRRVIMPARGVIDLEASLVLQQPEGKLEIHRQSLESLYRRYNTAVQADLMDLHERWKDLQSGFAHLRLRYMFPDQLTKI
jgi:hypothetical protein